MAADLDLLQPDFRDRIDRLLLACRQQGVEMRPYMGLRTPLEQAKLWRQSRATEQIQAKIAEFRAAGAPFLADCLAQVGPQHGDPVTNAPPGLSWHQWGEAVDCFWLVNGQAEWSTQRLVVGRNGYRVMAQTAQAQGLTPGGLFATLKDWPHLQLRPAASPLATMALADIDRAMAERFGD